MAHVDYIDTTFVVTMSVMGVGGVMELIGVAQENWELFVAGNVVVWFVVLVLVIDTLRILKSY